MLKKIFVQLILCVLIQFSLEYDLNEDYNSPDLAVHMQKYIAAQRIQKKQDSTQFSDSGSIKAAPEIKQDYTLVENWPTPSKKLGAISAVALDVYKNVVVFHRVDRIWNGQTFNVENVFQQRKLGPISENTIITFDRDTGNVVGKGWGKNMFYMPHGLHIRGDFYYITDVALHQVFRFDIKNSTERADLTLGEAFKPGRLTNQFCKPTSVASMENGDFFVADGYCNSRIIKYSFEGKKLLEWGRNTFSGYNANPIGGEPPNSFAIPHALTLVPDKNLLCVADRENGRVQCFNAIDQKFHSQYHSPIVGERLFSVDYANNTLFVINGPESHSREVAGYGFDMTSSEVSLKFGTFLDPHDIAVTSDGREIYVGDLSDNMGHRLYKFLLNGVKPTITREGDIVVTPVSKQPMRRGETALIVGSIVLLFAIFTVGIAVLITKRKRRGNEEQYTLMQK